MTLSVLVLAMVPLVLTGCGSPGSERGEEGLYDPLARNYSTELERAEAVTAYWADDSWYREGVSWTVDEEAFFAEINRNDELFAAFVQIAEESDDLSHAEAAYYFITKSDRDDAVDFLIEETRSSTNSIVMISMHSLGMHPSVKSNPELRNKVIARLEAILSESPAGLDEISQARVVYASRLASMIEASEVAQLIERHAKTGGFDEKHEDEMMLYVEKLKGLKD